MSIGLLAELATLDIPWWSYPAIDSGLHAEFLRGLAPSLPYPSTTALLTRKETVRP